MRKIIASARVSLDGVMQGPDGAQEDTSDGFDLGGIMKFRDAKGGAAIIGLVGTSTNPTTCCWAQDLRHFCRLLALCSSRQPNWPGLHKSEQIRPHPGLGEARLGQQPPDAQP